MILPSSSQKHSQTYRWVRGSWETDRWKSRISSSFFFLSSSHTKLLTSIACKLKHLLSYFTHRTISLSFIVAPFSPFVCKLARVAVLASCDSAKFYHDAILSNTQKVEVQMCAYCACVVHMQTHFTTLCLWWLRSRRFPNPCQSNIWLLTTARRNSYQPVLVRIFRNCAIMELPFLTCRKCIHDV